MRSLKNKWRIFADKRQFSSPVDGKIFNHFKRRLLVSDFAYKPMFMVRKPRFHALPRG